MRNLLALLVAFCSTAALAQVEVEKPWSRATAPGAKVAAGYMVLRNRGVADRLVGASSPAAARVETHVTEKDGDVLKMKQVKGYDVPAKGSFELKPGGVHLMLIDIRQPFREGDRVPLTLRFEKAGEVKIELPVSRAAPAAAKPSGHHGH